MAVTFGVMLHVDRAPAAVAPPLHVPFIEGKVISESSDPVLPVEPGQQTEFNMPRMKSSAAPQFPTYDMRGGRQSGGEQSGALLDVFA